MHHDQVLTFKMSPAANNISIKTHNEYNNRVMGFQRHQYILCTLLSKSQDHLYRICDQLHLLHKACSYIVKMDLFIPLLYEILFDSID